MSSSHSPKRIGPFAPLRRRSFSLLFGGQLTSALGDEAFALALPWTVIAVTGDPLQAGVVLAAEAVPRVLLLPFGGALADSINPRFVMLLSDIGRAAVVGALGVTLLSGLPPLWIVALLAALQGVGSGLFLPGSQSILPWTVRNAEIPAANGLMQTIIWLTLIVGPVLGGIAVAAQAAIAFLLDAASFIVSAITLATIRLSAPDTPAAKVSANSSERTGSQPADTGEETPVAGKSVLVLTTSPRLAIVRIEIEEIEVEEGPLEGATSEDSTSLETADSDVTLSEGAADGAAIEQAEDPSPDEPATTGAPDAVGAPIAVLSPYAVKPKSQPERPARASVLREIGAGLAYTFRQPLMRSTVVVSVLGNLAYAGTFGVALLLLSRSLNPSPVTLGLLLGACGVGGVLGGLMAGVVGRRRRRGPLILFLWLLEQLARSKGRRRLGKIVRYACLFDRPERALGASGG
jgi:MFS family permease